MKLTSGLAAVALASATLAAATVVAPAYGATEVPAPVVARSATGWLATQLTDGVIHNPNFGGFNDYGSPDDLYSGSFAKALVFAQVSGADARDYRAVDQFPAIRSGSTTVTLR